MDEKDGVRPSSATATHEALRTLEITAARLYLRVAAPEDGRTPVPPTLRTPP